MFSSRLLSLFAIGLTAFSGLVQASPLAHTNHISTRAESSIDAALAITATLRADLTPLLTELRESFHSSTLLLVDTEYWVDSCSC